MIIFKLVVVFVIVMGIVSMKKPMSLAVVIGSIATWILYALPTKQVVSLTINALTSLGTLKLILVMYLITFLQRMMEKRGAIELARKSLSALFNNRWVNCAAAPIFIGLLPSPNAAFIAGDMVSASASEYLTKEEQAVTTTFFRHISEAFLPTYSSILIALSLTGISAGEFVVGMLPMVAVLIILGCLFFLRGKVPMKTDEPASTDKMKDFWGLVKGAWAIFAVIGLVIAFNMEVYIATAIILVVYYIINKFKFSEVKPFFVSAFESKIVFNTMAVMVFKEMLTASGSINALPDFFSQFPIPSFLVFVLIFLFGTIVSGSLTIIVLCLPVAMATVPAAGLPLVVLLMSTTYTAMQISPTHICLALVAEHFEVSLGDIIKRTIPLVGAFMVISIFYYLVCTGFVI